MINSKNLLILTCNPLYGIIENKTKRIMSIRKTPLDAKLDVYLRFNRHFHGWTIRIKPGENGYIHICEKE